MKCQQAKLKCENRHTVSWIDALVKNGDQIQFQDHERWWVVEKTYFPILDKKDIKHGWKVGGLV